MPRSFENGTSDKIAVIGYYGQGNFGDDLLAASVLRLLRQVIPAEDILVSCDGRPYLEGWFPGIQCVPLRDILRRRPRHVVFGGGGVLHAHPEGADACGLHAATAYSFAKILGHELWRIAKAYAFCIGIGPLCRGGALAVTRSFLLQFDRVSVRDPESWEYWPDASVATDAACGIPMPGAKRSRTAKVAIVRRNWRHSPVPEFETAAAELRAGGLGVEFVSFQARDPGDIVWNPEHHSIDGFLELLGQYQAIVSMRAHGIFVGARLGIPTLAVEIEPKLRIFAREFGGGRCLNPNRPIAEQIRDIAGSVAPRVDWAGHQQRFATESGFLLRWLGASIEPKL